MRLSRKVLFCLMSIISPKLNTQLRYRKKMGKFCDLKNPKSFSEKINYLKLYDYANNPLVNQCADKYRVREYVTACGCGEYLNDLLGVYKNVEEINIDELPDSFVLKWNFGCGYNIIVSDKKAQNWDETKHWLKRWKRQLYHLFYAELHYKVKEKYLLCEKYIDANSVDGLVDYKLYCFHGEVLAILVMTRNKTKTALFMSPEWEFMSDVRAKYKMGIMHKKPDCLDEMLEIARKLSKPFPFVRVDLYESNGKPVFGELTFTPAAGVSPSETKIHGKPMGEYLHIKK